ncbi:MAG: hypothetical protein AB7U20_11735 [Planctomycetaceae bacterium]
MLLAADQRRVHELGSCAGCHDGLRTRPTFRAELRQERGRVADRLGILSMDARIAAEPEHAEAQGVIALRPISEFIAKRAEV